MDAGSGREYTSPEHRRRLATSGAGAMASSPVMASAARTATAATVTAALALTAVCWVIAIRLMNGMDMGTATQLGSFAFFITVWVVMMAAMMLPGAAPAAASHAHGGRLWAVPLFAGSYMAVWALAGAVVYLLDRPHGTVAAGAVVIAAGLYELTPLKKHFRRRCRERTGSGLRFGVCCAGSSAGLMAMLAALGVMSLPWMAAVAVLVTAQKLLPPRIVLDLPLALTIAGLGILVIVAPSAVPGLMPPM
jgi:predicted metal-binding membrane protein